MSILKSPTTTKTPSQKNNLPAGKEKIIDLILPLIVLISVCIYGMLYTGGIGAICPPVMP